MSVESIVAEGRPRQSNCKRPCSPLFSDEDADLREHRWAVSKLGYAQRSAWRNKKIKAHRVVMSRMLGRELTPADICDHINGDRTDNRRCNLRLTDSTGNAQNRTASTSASGYRGVSWHKHSRRWQASVTHNDRTIFCGCYSTAAEAAEAAASKRRELGFLGSEAPHVEC